MTWTKRAFDLSFSLIGLVILCPLILVIAFLIKISDWGPVFFQQERLGRQGKLFKIWKFRTMRVNPGGDPITVKDDPRVTWIGRILRRFHLDELPQLFNVLGGTMSLVGPRPEVQKYAAHYTQDQKKVLEFVPGITDPAVYKVRNYRKDIDPSIHPEEYYLKNIMPEKVRVSIEYAVRATVWSDFITILRTIFGVLR